MFHHESSEIKCVAIMIYLCRKFKTPDHWYPADTQSRALVDEYLAWQHLNIKKHCTKILWMKMVIPHLFQYAVPELKLKESMTELSHRLDLLKKKFLKDKPFLTGDRISLADVMALEDLVQEREDMDIIRQLQHIDKADRRQLQGERFQQQRGIEGFLTRVRFGLSFEASQGEGGRKHFYNRNIYARSHVILTTTL
ncbi:glutathione S-transferase theta-4-like isoform X4 [Notamacropus eugenii]|uniref:glutathione S-transferase theta-4-like isoform X4 n=1 Tax=Notamacropus eugenii TaxID=9315 RepID=UPI003B6775F7